MVRLASPCGNPPGSLFLTELSVMSSKRGHDLPCTPSTFTQWNEDPVNILVTHLQLQLGIALMDGEGGLGLWLCSLVIPGL